MAQNNQTHTYIRIDASGRDIPGTNVLRRSKPVTGKWKEVTAYECCNAQLVTDLTSTPADVTLTEIVFTLLCDDVDVAVLTVTDTSTDIAELAAALNDAFGAIYGEFEVDGSDIILHLKREIGAALCPDGTLSFTVTGT